MTSFARYSLPVIISIMFGATASADEAIRKTADETLKKIEAIVSLTDKASEADIVFGPAASARVYSTREAVKWGADFLVSWSRATDRKILYGYKLANVDLGQFRSVIERESVQPNDALIAIVNELKYGPLPILGLDKGYLAAPVLQVAPSLLKTASLTSIEYELQFKNFIIPSIVAASSLKGAGKEVSSLEEIFAQKTDAITYIASNKAIPGLTVDKYFLIANSAWTFPLSAPISTWGIRIKAK